MDIKDFDEWAALAKSDPAAFEAKRRAAIEALIDSAPEQHRQRLRGLQFRVDMERQRASNPLSATIRISNMMWSAFGDLREALDQVVNGRPAGAEGSDTGPVQSAEVLPFAQRQR
jgi:hypothetical protein